MRYPCRLFLFDLDGTLVDSREDIARAINAVLVRMGNRPLTMDDVLRFVGDGMESLMRRALREVTGMEPDKDQIATGQGLMLEEYGNHLVESTRLYPGVVETLDQIHWARMGLVSNKPEVLSRRILDTFGLAGRFCVILGGDSLPQRKPDPAPILEALSRCHASASETVMVGDSAADILAGRAAGVITCGISCGFRSREEIQAAGCDVLIGHFYELPRHFCPPPDVRACQ
jgi:phosphoglycolate phosphatase